MADRYPESHFPHLNLPGFQSEATIEDVIRPDTDWQSALSLSIFSVNPDNPTQLDVLTAIREEGTETHPDVVSTPTGRFPKLLEPGLVESRAKMRIHGFGDAMNGAQRDQPPAPSHFRLDNVDTKDNRVIASYRPNIQSIPSREDPLAFFAHELLARKLGLGEALQKKHGSEPIGTISLMDVVAGFSYAADDKKKDVPLWEPLVLYGAVMLLHDRELIPAKTGAYRSIGWTSIHGYGDAVATKRADILVPSISPADEATVCVRGLCLTTTGTVTRNQQRLLEHLGLQANHPHPFMSSSK